MRKSICALAILAGAASTAMADQVRLDYKGQDGQGVSILGRGGVNAGYMKFDVIDDGSQSGGRFSQGDRVRTFCIDITENLIDPDWYEIKGLSTVDPTITAAEQTALENMFAYVVANNVDLTNSSTGSTMQLAIWEVLSDLDLGAANGGLDSLNVKADTFQLNGTGFQGDNPLLTALFNAAINGTNNPNIFLHGLDSSGGQDQMYFTVIPLPTSAGLAAVGLSGVLLAGRRRFA